MRNKVPWVVGAVLILVLVIGAVVATKSKESAPKVPPPPESARAVVLPANQPRTVVVPPCNTPVSDTARAVSGGRASTPGATAFELPRERGVRTLLVPHCQPTKTGSVNAEGSIPSSAFVLPDKRRLTKNREGKIDVLGVIAESQLILPDRSKVSTVVVPGCTKKEGSKGRDIVLGADKGNPDLVVAPSC